MRKIKSPRQLQSEKRRLEKKQTDLESAIRRDWTELRKSAKPRGFIINSLSGWVDKLKTFWG